MAVQNSGLKPTLFSKLSPEPLRPEVNLLIRAILALISFILGFNLSRSAFFREYPLFGIPYLAEIIISTFSAFLGFYYLQKVFFMIKNAIEEFLIIVVTDVVSHFWELQSKRIQEQRRLKQAKKLDDERQQNELEMRQGVLLDTSALIDGRILDIVKLHFFENTLIIPQYVVEELHVLSDSKDDQKRKKGRRGLDILKELKKKTKTLILESKHSTQAPAHTENLEVDKKLVQLAKQLKIRLLTLDFNLAKVASVTNVTVLNINELANALKTVVLPGDNLSALKIVHIGKDKNQGVGYLQDGTMVVVAGAGERLGEEVTVEVKKLIQSPAGKMIFANLTA